MFCQQLIDISVDGLSKKNMFFIPFQPFTSFFTQLQERVNIEEAGVAVPFTICFFFPDPVLLKDIRQGKIWFPSPREETTVTIFLPP